MSALGQLLDAVETRVSEVLVKYNVLARLEAVEKFVRDFEKMDTPSPDAQPVASAAKKAAPAKKAAATARPQTAAVKPEAKAPGA